MFGLTNIIVTICEVREAHTDPRVEGIRGHIEKSVIEINETVSPLEYLGFLQ